MNQSFGVEHKSADNSDFVSIGFVRKPIALAGWCGVTAHGNVLGSLSTPAEVLIGKKPSSESLESIVIKEIKHGPKGFRCLFDGYSDRDSVERFRDLELFIEHSKLPNLSDDEYYLFELENLDVADFKSGNILGYVKSVHNYPSTDALEVILKNKNVVLIPLNKETVTEIDRDNGIIFVDTSMLEDII